MKTIKQLLQEAESQIDEARPEPFSNASQGALMHAVDNHKNAPGVKSASQLISVMDQLRKKYGNAVQPQVLLQNALAMGIQPQDIVQFCGSILDSDERDIHGGYEREILAQVRDTFKKAR